MSEMLEKPIGARSTDSSNSSIIGKVQLKVFNFDAAEVIDDSIPDKEIEYGILMKDYPCFNDIYASKHVLDYVEANSKKQKPNSDTESLHVYKL